MRELNWKEFLINYLQVRVYRGIEDEDPSSHLVGDEALAVACSADKFYVSAADTNNVQGGNSIGFFSLKIHA